MEKTIIVSGKEVKFKATAGLNYRYREKFNRDFLKDLQGLQKKLEQNKNEGNEFEIIDLQMFERIAWTMAKTADKTIPDIEEWLDQFDMFAITQILPEILSLVAEDTEQINAKKKTVEEAPKEEKK